MLSFNGTATPRSPEGIARAAKVIGVEEAALRAVMAVEAAGSGFDAKRRPKMLFEGHAFFRELGQGPTRDKAVALGLAYPKWDPKKHPYPKDSYPRLIDAIRLDETCALRSASWGLPQIMGSNHKAAGFVAVQDMVRMFCQGEDEQLEAMARFITANRGMALALRAKDWPTFARLYNGPGKVADYATKLAQAYAIWAAAAKRVPKPPVTPPAAVPAPPVVEPAPDPAARPGAATATGGVSTLSSTPPSRMVEPAKGFAGWLKSLFHA